MKGASEFSKELLVPMYPQPALGVGIESWRMQHEVSDKGGRVWKHTVFTIMFIIPMFMLILITCYGYKLATMTKYIKVHGSEDGYIALMFGVLTVIFGLVYFGFGLIIVAELVSDLLGWFRREDNKTSENEEREEMTSCQIIMYTAAIMVSMFMLTWAIYNGYKLAAEAQEVVIYSRLSFMVGVTSMGFGFIYFIYGICIAAKSACHLPGSLYQTAAKTNALLEKKCDATHIV